MRKIAFKCITILMCITFTSCFSNSDKSADYGNKVVIGMGGIETYNDDYILYTKNEMLHYFDTTNNTDTIVCNKPQCKHTPPSSQNRTPDCDGYVGDAYCFVMDDNYLYYFYSPENSGFTTKNICRANKDGSDKKDIESLENVQNFLYGYYADGYLIFSYRNTFDENGEDLEKLESSFVYVDLSAGKASKSPLKKDYGATTYNLYMQNNKIYSKYTYETEKIDFEKWQDNMGDEFNEYASKITKYEINCFDLDSGEEHTVYEGDGSWEISMGNGYACLISNDEIKCLNLDTKEIDEIELGTDGYTLIIDGDDIVFINYSESILKRYSTDKKKIIEEVKLESNNYCIPDITSSYAYFWYTDDDDEFCAGRLTKEDFYKGKISSVEFLKKNNTED